MKEIIEGLLGNPVAETKARETLGVLVTEKIGATIVGVSYDDGSRIRVTINENNEPDAFDILQTTILKLQAQLEKRPVEDERGYYETYAAAADDTIRTLAFRLSMALIRLSANGIDVQDIMSMEVPPVTQPVEAEA